MQLKSGQGNKEKERRKKKEIENRANRQVLFGQRFKISAQDVQLEQSRARAGAEGGKRRRRHSERSSTHVDR